MCVLATPHATHTSSDSRWLNTYGLLHVGQVITSSLAPAVVWAASVLFSTATKYC